MSDESFNFSELINTWLDNWDGVALEQEQIETLSTSIANAASYCYFDKHYIVGDSYNTDEGGVTDLTFRQKLYDYYWAVNDRHNALQALSEMPNISSGETVVPLLQYLEENDLSEDDFRCQLYRDILSLRFYLGELTNSIHGWNDSSHLCGEEVPGLYPDLVNMPTVNLMQEYVILSARYSNSRINEETEWSNGINSNTDSNKCTLVEIIVRMDRSIDVSGIDLNAENLCAELMAKVPDLWSLSVPELLQRYHSLGYSNDEGILEPDVITGIIVETFEPHATSHVWSASFPDDYPVGPGTWMERQTYINNMRPWVEISDQDLWIIENILSDDHVRELTEPFQNLSIVQSQELAIRGSGWVFETGSVVLTVAGVLAVVATSEITVPMAIAIGVGSFILGKISVFIYGKSDELVAERFSEQSLPDSAQSSLANNVSSTGGISSTFAEVAGEARGIRSIKYAGAGGTVFTGGISVFSHGVSTADLTTDIVHDGETVTEETAQNYVENFMESQAPVSEDDVLDLPPLPNGITLDYPTFTDEGDPDIEGDEESVLIIADERTLTAHMFLDATTRANGAITALESAYEGLRTRFLEWRSDRSHRAVDNPDIQRLPQFELCDELEAWEGDPVHFPDINTWDDDYENDGPDIFPANVPVYTSVPTDGGNAISSIQSVITGIGAIENFLRIMGDKFCGDLYEIPGDNLQIYRTPTEDECTEYEYSNKTRSQLGSEPEPI